MAVGGWGVGVGPCPLSPYSDACVSILKCAVTAVKHILIVQIMGAYEMLTGRTEVINESIFVLLDIRK